MLIRISLIIAILAGLAAAGLNYLQVKDKITATIKDRDDEREQHRKFEQLARETQKKLDTTTKELASTKEELNTTKDERDRANATAEEATKKLAAATDQLKKTEGERNDAQNKLAGWEALGIPLTSIKATLASLKEVSNERDVAQAEQKILQRTIDKLNNELAQYLDPDYVVQEPEGLKGKVLVADPKYDFVVLDFGDNKKVLRGGKLLVNRGGQLIAKVVITSVQPDRSIANVLPGWKLGDVMEGDEVLY